MHIKKTQSLSRLKGQYKTQSMMQYEMRIPIFRSYNKTYLYKRGFTGHLKYASQMLHTLLSPELIIYEADISKCNKMMEAKLISFLEKSATMIFRLISKRKSKQPLSLNVFVRLQVFLLFLDASEI